MNSCNTDIFFSNYYHWQSVRFELPSLRISTVIIFFHTEEGLYTRNVCADRKLHLADRPKASLFAK